MRNLFSIILLIVSLHCTANDSTAVDMRHYDVGYNFVVTVDTLIAQTAEPQLNNSSLPYDTLLRNQKIVVGAFRPVTSDSTETMWVQIGTYTTHSDTAHIEPQAVVLWINERQLLSSVAPDNDISLFIHTFVTHSRPYLLVGTVVWVFVCLLYTLRHRRHSMLLLIDSSYNCLFAFSIALLLSIVYLTPRESLTYYYYYPTLNPFVTNETGLQAMLFAVWFMVISFVACLYANIARHRLLHGLASTLCPLSLGAATCLVVNPAHPSVLSIVLASTMAIMFVISIVANKRSRYVCGKCNRHIEHLGRCPHCGAENV